MSRSAFREYFTNHFDRLDSFVVFLKDSAKARQHGLDSGDSADLMGIGNGSPAEKIKNLCDFVHDSSTRREVAQRWMENYKEPEKKDGISDTITLLIMDIAENTGLTRQEVFKVLSYGNSFRAISLLQGNKIDLVKISQSLEQLRDDVENVSVAVTTTSARTHYALDQMMFK